MRPRFLQTCAPPFATLTPRERQIMSLVTAGLMNKQVAAEIGVAEITVKIHRGHIMRKMAAKSLPDLVRMAQMLGIGQASGGAQT
ncbi:FixJ family two-component response regulator [Bradyrhizobium elkanii]